MHSKPTVTESIEEGAPAFLLDPVTGGTGPERFAAFAVARSTGSDLTYRIPPGMSCVRGALHQLSVQKKLRVGVLLREVERPSFPCLDAGVPAAGLAPLPETLLALAHWAGTYYCAPPARVYQSMAPRFVWDAEAASTREKRFPRALLEEGRSLRGESGGPRKKLAGFVPTQPPPLRPEQLAAAEAVLAESAGTTLLYGVTGSGKTEVYLHIAARTLEEGRQVLMLVPEIALTPQMCARFRERFGPLLAVLHSGVTQKEHEQEWLRVNQGIARVVLGVRSAVFAPLHRIGLIVVDEEHDSSYKSDEFPCYQARDMAVKRAQLEGARCVLGSATPSLESYWNAAEGRYRTAALPQPVSGKRARWEVLDVRSTLRTRAARAVGKVEHDAPLVIHDRVRNELRANAAQDNLGLVILNRRGYAHFALCTSCGESLRCPNCSVSTTLHERGRVEICHYCSYKTELRSACPTCRSTQGFLGVGFGTQNVEEELRRRCPEVPIERLDRDVLTSNTRLAALLDRFRAGETKCLVGTQILSKGHDFPDVTLVAVLHVEDGLHLPDFRSAERTFQLLIQAGGRAGRAHKEGLVIVQTASPEHPVLTLAEAGRVDDFLKTELETRKLAWLPPWSRMLLLEVALRGESEARTLADAVRAALIAHWQAQGFTERQVRLSGPQPAALPRLRGLHRFHLCISAMKSLHPSKLVPESLGIPASMRAKVRIDVDPQSFL